MVNILSNQLKRRFLVPDDGNELTMLQRHMLHFIIVGSMHQDIFQKDVEAEFHIRKSTATGILQLLEKKGFICREGVERDGRLKRVVPTVKALAMRERVMQSLRCAEKQMLQGIDKEDLEVCMKVLAQMSRNLSCKEQDCKEQECRLT
ncbi:MAG: winged helix-turn-helix transcriptional regulator [Clostridium sp.]|nr:winged helix-turn-helix transcriptional regulator [Clostridium sp.]